MVSTLYHPDPKWSNPDFGTGRCFDSFGQDLVKRSESRGRTVKVGLEIHKPLVNGDRENLHKYRTTNAPKIVALIFEK